MTTETAEQLTEEESEFEASFKEFAENRSAPIEDPAADTSDDETHAADGSAESDGADGEAAPAGDEASDSEEDLLKDLPEAARKKFQALQEENETLQHKFNSNVGRVSAFQKQVANLSSQLERLKNNSGGDNDQPSLTDISTAMKGTPEEWAKFKEDYPEVANIIDKRFDMLGKATKEALDHTLAPVQDHMNATARKAAEDAEAASEGKVAKVYPTWAKVVATKDFEGWLESQSHGVASLADSDTAEDAIALIGLYDAHLVSNGKPSIRKTTDPIEPGVEDENPAKSQSQQLADRRKQQLEAGANVKSKPSGFDPSQAPADEFEANFKYFADQKDKAKMASIR